MLILYIPLYGCPPEDGHLSLKHVRGFIFMDKLRVYSISSHMLVYINDYKQNSLIYLILNSSRLLFINFIFPLKHPS